MQNVNANRDPIGNGHDPMPLGLQFKHVFHRVRSEVSRTPRRLMIAMIMGLALLAFEVFNYDTTRYALSNLLGDTSFMNFSWASILAIAFCSIDFAGLVRIFTPERGRDEPKEVWYLMGAWLLGATMNAMMTWWAVSLTVLDNEIGNEIMARETMLKVVPIFVAILVWLTRILFIGALSVAGEQLMAEHRDQQMRVQRPERRAIENVPPTVSVRRRRAVHLKERTNLTARPRPIARQETLLVNQPPRRPIVANRAVEDSAETVTTDPLTELFESKPATKKTPSRARKRKKGVQHPKAGTARPTGGLRTSNSKLQAKPRQ
ncbi:MAG: hypothetical protein ACPG8W_13120 [Candidatus Promineifilaceae bacterium]